MSKKSQPFEMDEKRLIVGAMVCLSLATGVMVLMPYFFTKRISPPPGLKPYTAIQAEGRKVYVSEGCVYCHSQQPRDAKQAPDAKRGWGRVSVAGDYYYDSPHLLGTMRTGPDLFNIAARQPSKDWQLGHLYQQNKNMASSVQKVATVNGAISERFIKTLRKAQAFLARNTQTSNMYGATGRFTQRAFTPTMINRKA